MTVAEKIIKPTKPGIFRTVFLYTGQGESTLLVIPTGTTIEDYKYVLIDSDKDNEENEIDLTALFKDLFKTTGELSIFINTHPHNDHVGGIKEVYDEIGFKEVWHSNHKAGGKHKKKYEDFMSVVRAGKTTQIDPLIPAQSDPHSPEHIDPLSPFQNDPLKAGKRINCFCS